MYFNQENSWQSCNYTKVVKDKLDKTKDDSLVKRITLKPEIVKN